MMAGGVGGMLAAMMTGGGLPPFPCALCEVAAAALDEWKMPTPEGFTVRNAVTLAAGTPVCAGHRNDLLWKHVSHGVGSRVDGHWQNAVTVVGPGGLILGETVVIEHE